MHPELALSRPAAATPGRFEIATLRAVERETSDTLTLHLAPREPALLAGLRQGGYLLYLRHAETAVTPGQAASGVPFSGSVLVSCQCLYCGSMTAQSLNTSNGGQSLA